MTEDIKKVSFNLSEKITFEIGDRITQANSFYMNNEIKKAFDALVVIKLVFIENLSPQSRKDLMEIEKQFMGFFNYLTSLIPQSEFDEPEKEFFTLNYKTRLLFQKYYETLMDLLEKHGFLLGQKADHTKMFN